jgi:hypothetical protein
MKMKSLLLSGIAVMLALIPVVVQAQAAAPIALAEPEAPYRVTEKFWDVNLGHHRALVRVAAAAPAVLAHLPWRLQMQGMQNHQILVMAAATGKPVKNVVRVRADRLAGDIVFEAAAPGDYLIYYLPLRPYGHMNDCSGYLTYACTAEAAWRQANRLADADLAAGDWQKLPTASLIEFQARSELDRFEPMEIIASEAETQALLARCPQPLLLFPEDRVHTIRMQKDLPLRWIKSGPGTVFAGEARRHEYYAFQIGVFAPRQAANQLAVQFSDLRTEKGDLIPAAAL